MNIFIMILVALFMAGFYMFSSPSQKVQKHDTEYAITTSDLRTIAQCTATTHNATINDAVFEDICIGQNGVRSEFVCLDDKLKITKCQITKNKKPAFSYIVTTTSPIAPENHNSMMEVLETYYSDSGTFGLFHNGTIMSGGTTTKRTVPNAIIEKMEITDGQLVYLTQYEIPDEMIEYIPDATYDIVCPTGTAKTYRFGRWQCIDHNTKTDCGGDMIWDSDLYECIPDESKKPLCADNQTAVLVDTVWECVNPFPEKSCPDKMIARLNYNTLEWECVTDPASTTDTKKCANVAKGAVYGALGTTLRVPQTSCTDCERMITDPETCKSICVPDPSKISDPSCYPGATSECSGSTRAFYFGFPNGKYITDAKDVIGDINVPLDTHHSQNRKFNCIDCGDGIVDTEKSKPPYVAICK
ncbi:MAG: hypothetical protein IJY99_03060 [Alphaproteobacteria bacterium]|nr:hypothetical protein [Alphaproteobacteria bacterium]